MADKIVRNAILLTKTIFDNDVAPRLSVGGVLDPIAEMDSYVKGSIHVVTDPGAGQTITWMVSNDGITYAAITDEQGTAITATTIVDDVNGVYPIPIQAFMSRYAYPAIASDAGLDIVLKIRLSG